MLSGACGCWGTTLVAAEAAWLLPALLEPVTTTSSAKPTSVL